MELQIGKEEANNIEANFWLIPNAYHVDAMLKYPDEYGQRMKQFFEENLK